MYRLNPQTYQAINTLGVDGQPVDIAASMGTLWVLWTNENGEAMVSRVDL